MGKKSAPPPPDYTPIAQASQAQVEVANRALDVQSAQAQQVFDQSTKQADRDYQLQQSALDWAKGAYDDQSNTNKAIIAYDMQQQDRQAAIQQASADNAAKAQKRYESVYQPLEDAAVHDAMTYASPERKAQLMGSAAATTAQATEQARLSAQSSLESFGIDPSSTRYAAMDAGLRVQGAASQAAAATSAGLQADATQRALQANAINVGRGLPSDVNAGNNTAINAGSAGVGAGSAAGNLGLGTISTGGNVMGTGVQYAGLGNQALGVGGSTISAPNGALNAGTSAIGAWGNTLNQGYNNQLSAWQATQNASSGFGSILGAAAGMAGFALAEGGAVPGAVPVEASPTGGRAIDDVPARLTPGEFVVPNDVTKWKGEEFFQKLITQSRKDKMSNAPAQPQAVAVPMQRPTFTSPSAIPAR